MADVSHPLETVVVRRSSWGAIWAGVFTFIAIWSVFGALGFDIFFASAGRNGAGGDMGMEIWGVILTIIAMFIAGRVTGTLAGVTEQLEGVTYGMVMFGLSVVSMLLLVILAGAASSTTAAGTAATMHAYVIELFYSLGWSLFLGLFLGWLAALGGASTAHRQLASPASMQQQVRHA
jgi:hypothetical protein